MKQLLREFQGSAMPLTAFDEREEQYNTIQQYTIQYNTIFFKVNKSHIAALQHIKYKRSTDNNYTPV